MMDLLTALFHILIFPGFLFLSVVSLLISGVDRKVVARMQSRKGPPLLQPLYDVLKLLGKECIVPAAANRYVFLLAPVLGMASLVVLALFIPIFGFTAMSSVADIVVILYLLIVPSVALIIGGAASGSPYAGVGLSREMVSIMACELPLVMVVLSVARVCGGEAGITFSMKAIAEYQAANGPLLFNINMIPAALAMLLLIPGESGSHPFDIAEAETEICEGILAEYSGAPLAIFKMNFSLKMFIMTMLFCAFFLGGAGTGIVALDALFLVILSLLLTVVMVSLLRATTARLKVEQVFKFYWTIVAALAGLSLVMVWLF